MPAEGLADTPSGRAYIGRFAPSPSGPLHFGSLLGAIASYLDAKANKGRWLVRMEDIDPPREVAGAADLILKTLEHYCLCWDGKVLYQSSRLSVYHETVVELCRQQQAYTCSCSRKQIRSSGSIYPGICRNKTLSINTEYPIRLKVTEQIISFDDFIQRKQYHNLAEQTGDFIIRRRDKLPAYQLAVVVDDHFQNISHIIRGSDLLSSTPRQIYLQQLLRLGTPQYVHIPVIVDNKGIKLSKQTFAAPLQWDQVNSNIIKSLSALGQNPPMDLINNNTETILNWAIDHWQLAKIPQMLQIPENDI